ncbi:MAG: hypothetical protein J6D07_01470 [Mogibacterium sp.]|nr:hypothetical protein [Mogibacterium sp.]
MRDRVFYNMEEYLDDLKRRRDSESRRFNELADYSKFKLKRRKSPSGKWYYYGYETDDAHMKLIGDDNNDKVNRIKEFRYLEKSLRTLDDNIRIVEDALKSMRNTDFESVNLLLPGTYRDAKMGMVTADERSRKWKESAEALKARREVYRPEDLKNRTDDGTYVRSKSEMIIYNYLLSIGVTFVYELPMRIQNRFVVPDFTLLSEADYETEIIIEHQGLMEMDSYRNRFGEKVYMYLNAGYVPGKDIFFSFDSSDGGFDKRPIEVIVKNFIRPSS